MKFSCLPLENCCIRVFVGGLMPVSLARLESKDRGRDLSTINLPTIENEASLERYLNILPNGGILDI